MSSLVPGPIFISPGLNRNSTPTPPDITPAQLDEKYRRADFNGHDWPRESPISRMYDVANSSTKLIILNNKYGKNGTRLRGYYTGPKKPERHIDPNRHRAPSPRNPRFHTACYDSSSPKFEPSVKSDLEWINASHRPPNALIGAYLYETRTSVNPRRHATCQAPTDLPVHEDRPRSRMSLPPNKYFTNSEYADMSIGEKIYMWSIERIYSMDKMKQLKQEQYKKLLDMEAKKGYHGYQEYVKYMRYINSAKDRSYGTGTPSEKSRSRSAYSARSQRSKSASSRSSPAKSETRAEDIEGEKQDQPERPKTSLGQRQEPLNDTKSSESDNKQRTASVGSADKKSIGSQRSQQKSPSPSCKGSARSSILGSQRSLRSKSGSRASSAVSAKSVEKTKGDHSDSSLTNGEDDAPQLHKEGKDRPKSRLGHPSIDDKDPAVLEGEGTPHVEGKDRPKSRLGHPGSDNKDEESIHSSTLSIKSDHASLSSDSGVENGRKEKKNKHLTDTSSQSSLENTNRRGNNQDKKNGKLDQSLKAKQNKKMGSRSSVNSKSSSRSESEAARGSSQSKRNQIDEMDNKRKTEGQVQMETKINDTTVHRIPSGTFVENETTNDAKAGEEKNVRLENDNGETEKENAEKSTSDSVENPKVDNKVHFDDNTEDKTKETEASEQKSEDIINDKPVEASGNTKEGTLKADTSIRSEEHNAGITDDEKIAQNTEEEAKPKGEGSESQQKLEEEKIKTEDGKNILKRQDSFFDDDNDDDDDDDRRVNKDLDKIEY